MEIYLQDVYLDEESLEKRRNGELEEASKKSEIIVAHGTHEQLQFFKVRGIHIELKTITLHIDVLTDENQLHQFRMLIT
jgi:hypothetical protein